MKESENNAKLVANMISTQPGDHILFRGYGITALDSLRPPTRSEIATQAARWYPDVRVSKVHVNGTEANEGHFDVSVELR